MLNDYFMLEKLSEIMHLLSKLYVGFFT